MTEAASSAFLAQLERLGRWRFALLLSLVLLSLGWLIGGMATSWSRHSPALVNAAGENIGRDFIAPYGAGTLALAGDAAAAYDFAKLQAAEQQVIGAPLELTPWLYPPSLFLVAAPLALLPYLIALIVWLGGQLFGLLLALRRLVPHPLAAIAALIFPGTAQSLIAGQNGLLSALLVAGGLSQLERRPVLAGIFFGALSVKPQMAVAAFVALLFGAYFRSLVAAIVTAAALAVASALIFGVAPWLVFIHQLDVARNLVDSGEIPLDRMVTVYAAARLGGMTAGMASLLQSVTALGALGAVAYLWRRKAALAWRGATLALAIPLATPYALYYDLVILILPILWLTEAGLRDGFRRGEVALLVAVWIAPVAGWLFAEHSHWLLTPLGIALLLVAMLRRARAEASDARASRAAPLAASAAD